MRLISFLVSGTFLVWLIPSHPLQVPMNIKNSLKLNI